MKKYLLSFTLILLLAFFVSCEKSKVETKEEQPYLLEQVGTTAIAQLYADEFKDLDLNEKILAYYLAQAVIAGDRIDNDQSHRHALEIKDILEEIITHKEGIEPETFRAILD